MSADPQPSTASTAAVASTPPPRSHPLALLGLFLVLAFIYLWLHARMYDGDAIKNAVWNRDRPSIATVNHPYPGVWYWAWWKVGSGFVGTDFDSRMAWIEALNALLGAGAATLAASTLLAAGVRLGTALAGALFLGLTHAWFYHSTQATEPIMAQFWMMLSYRCAAAIPTRGRPAVIGCAVAWAIAVGAYQSYILGGLGLLLIVAQNRKHVVPWLAASAIVGTSLYVGAAVGAGARSARGVLEYITHKPDGEYWGFIRPSVLLQLPFGLANAITPPWPANRSWPGLRMGWQGLSVDEKAITILIVLLTLSLAAAVLFLRVAPAQRRLKLGLVVVFICGLFAPFYLLPYYNKLWLLSLGAFGLAATLVADSYRRGFPILLGLLALMMLRNSQQSYFQRTTLDNPLNRGAVALEQSLTERDFLICDGWDASNIYNVRNPGRNLIRLIYAPVSGDALAARIAETRQNGGKIYVFGLMELTPERFELSDIAKRGKKGWYPVIQSYKPKARLVWQGAERGILGDLYEIVD